MSVNTYSKYEDNPMSLSYAAYHQLIEYLETDNPNQGKN